MKRQLGAWLLLALGPLFAQPNGGSWAPLNFLMGEWVGEGGGEPGQGSGWFTFRQDLQGAILRRENHAEYPAAKDRPAFSHDDLTIVYRDAAGKQLRASYFDNEGHVIQYVVNPREDGVQFLSEAAPGEPRYRLTYVKAGADRVRIRFEIAPPGQPEAFRMYIEAKARRKRTPS